MTLLNLEQSPTIPEAWDKYGHQVKWSNIYAHKSNGHYAVVAWENPDGTLSLADLCHNGQGWIFNNDTCEDDLPKHLWPKVKLDRHLESYTYPGRD